MRPYNDIDIYVEDRTYVGVYERLVNKALDGKAKVSRVIPLGPRDVVIKAASNDNVSGRPTLYIIDGDLDLIAFRYRRRPARVHALRVYALENLLCEKAAIEEFIGFACPHHREAEAMRAVNWTEVDSEINDEVGKYFILLGMARRLDLRAGRFALNPPSVSKANHGQLIGVDSAALKKRLREVIAELIARVGLARYRAAKKFVLSNIRRRKLQGVDFVSAKAFVLPYLAGRIAQAKGINLSQKVAVSYLAKYCTLAKDRDLVRKIRAAVRSS